MEDVLNCSKEDLLKKLFLVHPKIFKILRDSPRLRDARVDLLKYLNKLETHYFNIYSDKKYKNMHILERNNAKECIRVLKNVIRTENEKLTGFSSLKILRKLSQRKLKYLSRIEEGFLAEFFFLLKGIKGDTDIFPRIYTTIHEHPSAREKSIERSKALDKYSQEIRKFFKNYKTGYDPDIVENQRNLKENILTYLGGSSTDWSDWHWQLKNIISDFETLKNLISLSDEEMKGLKSADEFGIPFQITPHYLSLFDKTGKLGYDRAIRAQVLPSETYCNNVEKNKKGGGSMDFMNEKSTTPIDGITRRYPQILIIKPFDSCPQICVYCQRNWEIKRINDTFFDRGKIINALNWIGENPNITEVLVTGGDPLTLPNREIKWLFKELSSHEHIERIRLGTRVLVTLPFRVDDGLIKILDKYFKIGLRDISVMTHFEHPTEFTYDSLDAIKKIKLLGINLYNQQVLTYYNSRKYETCLLRKVLKKSGIDPYYIFNTKGKQETIDFRIPIPRISQEAKEEARLLPGLDRTSEPVFNVPKLGKSHLRAWQDHEPIMIMPDGGRVYRFYPWESRVATVDDYIYTDVSIYKYLKRLMEDGEDVGEYGSIWYYF